MSKRKPLPTWASKHLQRIKVHARGLSNSTKSILADPTDTQEIMELFAKAGVILELVDQLQFPEEEDEDDGDG